MKIRSKSTQQIFLQGINPVIRFLIISDVLIVGATGMFAPLFALFVEDFIVGGDALVVSMAMGIFLISRSLIQIPVAILIDKIKGDKDDYWFMVIFSLISALSLLLYLVISQPWHLYLTQIVIGISIAITYPSYMALFTRYIDKDREGTEWGVYYTLLDLGSAALAVIGGYIVTFYGFYNLIIVMSIISILGSLLLIPIKYSLKKSK